MKVALFVHCFFPEHFYGTETYTLELARNLRDLGHEPTVVTAVFAGESPQSSLIHRYDFNGIRVISIDKNRYPNTRVKDTYFQPEMAPILGDLVNSLAPDLAHVTHLVNHTGVLLEVLAAKRIPTVATFTDFFGFCYTNKLEAHDGSLCAGPATPAVNCLACHLKANALVASGRLARLTRRASGAALAAHMLHAYQKLPSRRHGQVAGLVQDVEQRPRILMSLYGNYARAIVPTTFIADAYERNGFGGVMTRIPFGVDIDRRAKPEPAAGSPVILGFVGQLMAHKGPDVLIEAARRALRPEDYEVRIYGSEGQDPTYMARLRRDAAGLPVRFMGTFPSSEMRAVLDSFDALVIPSRWYENSPLVLLNALASHTPVIVSDVAGMTEFVQDGVNGFAFERGSAAALADVLRRIAADRTVLPRMSAATDYDVTTRAMTQRTLEVYARAIAGEPARA